MVGEAESFRGYAARTALAYFHSPTVEMCQPRRRFHEVAGGMGKIFPGTRGAEG